MTSQGSQASLQPASARYTTSFTILLLRLIGSRGLRCCISIFSLLLFTASTGCGRATDAGLPKEAEASPAKISGWGQLKLGQTFEDALVIVASGRFDPIGMRECLNELPLRGCGIYEPASEIAVERKDGIPYHRSLSFNRLGQLTDIGLRFAKEGDVTPAECLDVHGRTLDWLTRDHGPLAQRVTEERHTNQKSPGGVSFEVSAPIEDGSFIVPHARSVGSTTIGQRRRAICAEHDVVELVFDPAKMADFETACDQIGFPAWRFKSADEPAGKGLKMVNHAQGTRVVFEDRQYCMPRSIERFEDRILNETIVIDDSPVTYMCASNAALIEDGMKNRAFDKKRSRGRIDGIVTSAMGAGAADNVEMKGRTYAGSYVVDLDDDDGDE